MKRLLVVLVKKFNDDWWEVRSATGSDPDDVREGHFTFPVLLEYIRSIIRKVTDDEKHSR